MLLTKTAFLAYTHCPQRYYLARHQPHLGAAPDPAGQRRLRQGQAVDVHARTAFPGGRLIPYRPRPEDMAPLTTAALAAGTGPLFQATFAVRDMLVKVDVLAPLAEGWHLIEVKSTTSYKEAEHLADVAFQLHVLTASGLPVERVSLMHLNSGCRFPDLSDLFTLTDVTETAQAAQPAIVEAVTAMRRHSAPIEPAPIGRYCIKPHRCPFYDHCWSDVTGWTIHDVPNLTQTRRQALADAGVRYVTDIPAGFSLGHKRATEFVERIGSRSITIERDPIAAELAALTYPLYFIDFETIDYAIPRFPGCKPYQQLPFQYSCHILEADGCLTHVDYLHTKTDDPRPALAAALLNDIGPVGTLVAYNSPFEARVLRELAAFLPADAHALLALVERLWDQLALFRRHYHHYAFGNSKSLKSVLPVVVPELTYRALDVQDGLQAQVVWETMISSADSSERGRLAEQLRAYCELDTLAMVELQRRLT